jgi:hypothetical protein
MASTVVSFDLKSAGYASFANQTLTFRLITAGASAADDYVVLPGVVTATSASNGTGSVTLFRNGDSDVQSIYEVILPNREKSQFIIPIDTATISLADLLVNHAPGGVETQQSTVFADAIKRSNHTGTQLLSTISDNSTIQLKLSEGAFVDGDKTKLDGIETAATADQTASEIRTLVGSASNSNVFTDAEQTKLAGVASGATADQSAASIKSLYESNSDTNAFTDSDHTKLDGIETGATADQTASEIRSLVESATDSNVFTDADHTKLDGIDTANTLEVNNLDATGDITGADELIMGTDTLVVNRVQTNVGVGTLLPYHKLHVVDTNAGNNEIMLKLDNSSSVAGTAASIGFNVKSNSSGTSNYQATIKVERATTDAHSDIVFSNRDDDGALTEKVRILSETGITQIHQGVQFGSFTTTERGQISSPPNGLVIYNSTDSKFQGYAGGAWVDLH